MIEIEDDAKLHVPRKVLVAAGLLLLSVMLLAGTARLTDVGTLHNPRHDPAHALVVHDLRFSDRADGAIEVHRADGAFVTELAPESHGFIRGSLRALVRERTRRGFGAEQPFRVAAWPDGRLTLEDLATGTIVDLRAFGATNAASFAALLPEH